MKTERRKRNKQESIESIFYPGWLDFDWPSLFQILIRQAIDDLLATTEEKEKK